MKTFDVKIRKLRHIKNEEDARVVPYVVEVDGVAAKSYQRHCRSIFRFKHGTHDCVIKIEDGTKCGADELAHWSPLHGQCLQELSLFSNGIKKEDRRFFVPIIGAGVAARNGYVFVWVVQKWIRGTNQTMSDQMSIDFNRILTDYKLGDVWEDANCKIDETGQVKIYDYAL